VQLSCVLYLPPGYQEGPRLSALLWSYPHDFSDSHSASQITVSRDRFTTLRGASPLFLLLAGYAVLHNAAMPIVGASCDVNDSYLEQITMNARAAIDKVVEMGVVDRERVGVGGHSYGAAMAANLLAHSDLFRAGVALSGAYNRTLTPFGFQNEQRTLWEEQNLYMRISPLMHAHKIKAPLLLVHGELDDNAGTPALQSQRMYEAISGNGGTTRLVLLPHEGHTYVARESVEHVLSEMAAWFNFHIH
jgi:dipeptidyl aminopeptidase/acylaminoacyl peptidase